MEIDLEKAKEEFLKYTENYDLQDEKILGKQKHSLRVMEISKQIAIGLGLNKEEIELATLIGLLHDIARFEQQTQYKTFDDLESFDHGDYGEKILEKDIRKYIETDKYDQIIKKAVRNHNKFKIEDGLNEKEKLFAQIVRDADKLDIFYEAVEMFWKGQEELIENSTIRGEILEQFKSQTQIKREKSKKRETTVNNLLSIIAFIYDMNFKSSFEILKKEDYINKMINRFNMKDEKTKKQLEEVRINSNKYVEQKIQ